MRNYRRVGISFGILLMMGLAGCADEVEEHNEPVQSDGVQSEVSNTEEQTSEQGNPLYNEYIEKLEAMKEASEAMESEDWTTYAMKKVAGDRWELWDGLLNTIYTELKNTLSPDVFAKVRDEQRHWITMRDEKALEASEVYKGGTMEHLEYVSVLAGLTEERCYELVENYLK